MIYNVQKLEAVCANKLNNNRNTYKNVNDIHEHFRVKINEDIENFSHI